MKYNNFSSGSMLLAASLCLLDAGSARADVTLSFVDGGKETMKMAVSGKYVRIEQMEKRMEEEEKNYLVYDASGPAFTIVYPDAGGYQLISGSQLAAMKEMGDGMPADSMQGNWLENDSTPAGIDCRWAELTYSGITIVSLCLADKDDLNLTDAEEAAVHEAMSFGQNSLGDLTRYGLEGFPVKVKDAEGKVMALQSISRSSIAASYFAVPKGFERMEDDF